MLPQPARKPARCESLDLVSAPLQTEPMLRPGLCASVPSLGLMSLLACSWVSVLQVPLCAQSQKEMALSTNAEMRDTLANARLLKHNVPGKPFHLFFHMSHKKSPLVIAPQPNSGWYPSREQSENDVFIISLHNSNDFSLLLPSVNSSVMYWNSLSFCTRK